MANRRALPALAGLGALWGAARAVNRSLRDVRGRSMAPALNPGDRLLVRPPRPVGPQRGDVVVVRDPRRPDRVTVKRVVGLAHERVELDGGRLQLDGTAQIEPYVIGRSGDDRCTVPPGHLYVLGDNRRRSTDSRDYGPVPVDLVEAVVVGTVRPLRVGLRQAPVPLGEATG